MSLRPVTESLSNILFNIESKHQPESIIYIPAKIVKSCSSSISGILASLINTIFHLGKFPAHLKEAQAVPLHKNN